MSEPAVRDVADEVVRHHVEIAAWLTGRAERTREGFGVIADAHAPAFSYVGPDGVPRRRDDLLADLYAGHGTARGLDLQVTDVRVVLSTPEAVVATYLEHHRHGDDTLTRVSTAVLDLAGETPRWRHLHETACPQRA